MYKYLAGFLCLLFLQPLYAVQPYEFSSKELASRFMKEQEALGQRVNLTVQKQKKQRYTVLLKGYSQWGNAFKQAQLIEKKGFSNLEVVKGRYERGYSIVVHQSLSKKSIGKIFNQLRRTGMKNVKVHTDKVKLVRYIVMSHEPSLPSQAVSQPKISSPVKQVVVSKNISEDKPQSSSASQTIVKNSDTKLSVKPVSIIETMPAFDTQEDINLDDDVMIVVMSDSSDITYEMSIDDGDKTAGDKFEWAVDKVQLETELFTRSSSSADHVEYIHAAAHTKWQLTNHWEAQIAARVDGNYQHGDKGAGNDELNLDYGNSFLRYRGETIRLTVGSDTVRWGKMDTFSPTDNVATLDMSRGVLFEWGEAYRSAPIVRTEIFLENGKLDLVYLPYFREAELSDTSNVWYPVNFEEGAILGFGSSPLLKTLLQNSKIDDDLNDTDGGFGVRYSTSINSMDFDLTVQQVKLSTPYYQINPAIVANPALINQEKYALIEKHPRSWVIGGDTEFQSGYFLLRFEAAWFSDLPATTSTLQYETYDGLKWAGGAEFYPGDGDTRVNLQLSGSHIDEKEQIIDRDNIVNLSGEVETLFSNNRWKLSGRFNLGLDEKDIYISPEVTYLGWEPFEIYSAIHYLDGNDNTLGGFYENNTMLTLGWRGQF